MPKLAGGDFFTHSRRMRHGGLRQTAALSQLDDFV